MKAPSPVPPSGSLPPFSSQSKNEAFVRKPRLNAGSFSSFAASLASERSCSICVEALTELRQEERSTEGSVTSGWEDIGTSLGGEYSVSFCSGPVDGGEGEGIISPFSGYTMCVRTLEERVVEAQ